MKLFLTSQGFTTEEIAKSVEKLVEKPLKDINIAIINESYTGMKNSNSKRWLIEELSNIAKYIGGCIDFVNFRAYDINEIERRLTDADLIYIVGGKQHILSRLFKQTKTFDLMKKIAKEKVIMGTSAGAVVLGKQINSKAYWKERYSEDIDIIKNDKELELVNFNIMPHFGREDHLKWDKDFFDRVLKDNDFPIFAINDAQAIVYDNNNLYFVGGKPEVFGNKNNEMYKFIEKMI